MTVFIGFQILFDHSVNQKTKDLGHYVYSPGLILHCLRNSYLKEAKLVPVYEGQIKNPRLVTNLFDENLQVLLKDAGTFLKGTEDGFYD